MLAFYTWLAVALALAVSEMATTGFYLLFFAFGAIIAGVMSLYDPSLTNQLLAFIGASTISLFILRPILMKRIQPPKTKISNVSSLIGQRVVVLETVTQETGRVKLIQTGEVWSAQLVEAGELTEGAHGEIKNIQGAKLLIVPVA